MLIRDLFEYDAWHGPDDQWYSQSSDPWYDGNDQWHGKDSGDMMENSDDLNFSDLVKNTAFVGQHPVRSPRVDDIITARQLIGAALSDPRNEKHKYFEFLKYLRTKFGAEYSTLVHQTAAKLARKA